MKSRVVLILGMILLGLVALAMGAQARRAAAPLPEGREPLPPGATIQTVLDGMHRPVAFAFDPQGRIFYTEKDRGYVRLLINGTLQPAPVITFQVDSDNERGLL